MPIIQELNERQIQECLGELTQRGVPIIINCQLGDNWITLHSKVLQHGSETIWLDYPLSTEGGVSLEVAQPISLSFKVKHHKHVFNTIIEAVGTFSVQNGPRVQAIRIATPHCMQRIQRRAYNRVDVPRSRSVLATFWLGGHGNSPQGPAQAALLTWEGWVTNLSAGGFQVRAPRHAVPAMEEGDLSGVKLEIGNEYGLVEADVQLRHQAEDGKGGILLGYQFVGLNETAAGRQTLEILGRVVADFQRVVTIHSKAEGA